MARRRTSWRLVWLLYVLLAEYAVFRVYLLAPSCVWPLGDRGTRVLVVSDAQLTDAFSYGMAPGPLLSATEFISDQYMRRSFGVLQISFAPDVLVNVGDLFDGGRTLDAAAFAEHLRRWRSVFRVREGTLVLNATGNHDVGLGAAYSAAAQRQFEAAFGRVNFVQRVGGFDWVFVNAPALVERSGGHPAHAEAWDFVESLGEPGDVPRVLVSHVPLYRPRGAPCGPRRWSPYLRQHQGHSYQTMLSREQTRRLLAAVDPVHVFSGDDHEPCFVVHEAVGGALNEAAEDTVATISWMQGMYYPSAMLVSLPSSATGVYTNTCALPHQIALVVGYGVLLVITVVAEVRRQAQQRRALRTRSERKLGSSSSARAVLGRLASHMGPALVLYVLLNGLSAL